MPRRKRLADPLERRLVEGEKFWHTVLHPPGRIQHCLTEYPQTRCPCGRVQLTWQRDLPPRP